MNCNASPQIIVSNHAGHELPRHPVTGEPMNHMVQAMPMLVRVKNNADRLYVADDRWDQANSMEKQFALRLLMEICGRTCPVITVDEDSVGLFYNIRVDPAPTLPDPHGIVRQYNMAFIPADYCETVRSGFWVAR